MSARLPVLLATLLLVVGCQSVDGPSGIVFTDLTGTWSYRAMDVRGPGITCVVPGLILRFEQIPGAGAFVGSADSGEMVCSDSLGVYTSKIGPYKVENGYTFNEFMAFDLYNSDWRHDGRVVTPDSIVGTFLLRSGDISYQGSFVQVRQRNP